MRRVPQEINVVTYLIWRRLAGQEVFPGASPLSLSNNLSETLCGTRRFQDQEPFIDAASTARNQCGYIFKWADTRLARELSPASLRFSYQIIYQKLCAGLAGSRIRNRLLMRGVPQEISCVYIFNLADTRLVKGMWNPGPWLNRSDFIFQSNQYLLIPYNW